MDLATLWTLLLETFKASQSMGGSDLSTTTAMPIRNGACNPDGKTMDVKTGFCTTTLQLESKCSRLDIGHSSDCSAYDGKWCCYRTSSLQVSDPSQRSNLTVLQLASASTVTETPTTTLATTTSTTPASTTSTSTTTTTTLPSTTTVTTTSTTITTTTPTTTTTMLTTTTARSGFSGTNSSAALNGTTASNSTIAGNVTSSNRTETADALGADTENTVWRWSNGQTSVQVAAVASSKSVDREQQKSTATDSSASSDRVQQQITITNLDGGYQRRRQWMYPSAAANPCYIWAWGRWNDCWSDGGTF